MTPIRALLVEDDDTDAMFLRDQADVDTGHGRVVIERVDRLEEAVDHVARTQPDVVLLDLGLPDSQGLETLHRLQQEAPPVAVVVLTGAEDDQVSQAAMDAGAQDFIRKDQLGSLPLAQLLRHAVDRHRLQQELRDNEQRFRTLVELADDALWRIRVDDLPVLEYISNGIEGITGLTPDEMVADPQRFIARIHPDDLAATQDLTALRRGDPQHVLYRWARDDDTWVWLEDRRTPITRGDRLVAIQGITRDLTTIKQAEIALAEALTQERMALDKLRNLDELKSSFLQAVSHEIRTPLTVIQGFALTLHERGDHLDDEQRHAMTGRLAAAADRLQRLLADLIDVDRLNQGLLGLDRRPVQLQQLVTSVLGDLDRNAHLIVASCPNDLTAPLDRPKVERIVQNLVQNAVKHTPPGTRIHVDVTGDADSVRIAVADDGPGIDVDDADQLFEPFTHGRLARRHASPGTGIGLTLVARFAELHGGRAWIDHERTEGATFLVELPTQGGPGDMAADGPRRPSPGDVHDPPTAPTAHHVAPATVRRIRLSATGDEVTDALATAMTAFGAVAAPEGPPPELAALHHEARDG